jgi:hypothetical protein
MTNNHQELAKSPEDHIRSIMTAAAMEISVPPPPAIVIKEKERRAHRRKWLIAATLLISFTTWITWLVARR